MDILSTNANDTKDNRSLLPLDGDCTPSPDLLILRQLQQQQQQPPNRHHEFSLAADTMQAVPSAPGAQIGSACPVVRFCHPIHHLPYPSHIPAVGDRTDVAFRSYWDLLELPVLLELKRQRTERALLHSALPLLHSDALVCQSFAHLQQSSLTDPISSQQSSGSPFALMPALTNYHSAACSPVEVSCAGADSVVLPRPQYPMDLVIASRLLGGNASEAPLLSKSFAPGAVADPKSQENNEQAGMSKPSKKAKHRKYPWNAGKGETKHCFGSKRLANVRVNHERRRYTAESFAQKLFRLITDQERAGNTHIVEFLDGGGGFWLRQPDAISKLMPKYDFRGSKLSGFRRQLYSYGFKVEKDGPNKGAFKHPSFSRGDAELCKQIKRDNRYDFKPYDLDSL